MSDAYLTESMGEWRTRRRATKAMLFAAQGGACCYCGQPMRLTVNRKGDAPTPPPPDLATLEHLKRKANGGTDHPDNLALACQRCNSQRGTMSWVEFKTLRSAA